MNTTTLNGLCRLGVDAGPRNAVGVQISVYRDFPGLFQPWAVLRNPVGIAGAFQFGAGSLLVAKSVFALVYRMS